jgi:glycosyltransferase involved in cell wall biosynthesis
MKKVCFSIPCYNEEENIELMTRAIDALFQEKYKGIYEYVIEYIDNYSTDRTREVLQKLCERYPHNVRAIFNTRNFGVKNMIHFVIIVK